MVTIFRYFAGSLFSIRSAYSSGAILLFDLGNIKAADFQAGMLQHIGLNTIKDGFTFRSSQIQLVQIQLHLDMLLGIEFG